MCNNYALHTQVSYTLSIFGYTLAFSAVLAKMWRVFYIFHNPTTKKRSLKDWHLLLVVAVLSGILFLLLLIGGSVPATRQTARLVKDKERDDTKDVSPASLLAVMQFACCYVPCYM